VIHENHVDRLVLKEIDRFLAGLREFDRQAVPLEQTPKGHPRGPGIVDDEGALLRHGDTFFQFDVLVQTCVA
jgi:hypothetical protein